RAALNPCRLLILNVRFSVTRAPPAATERGAVFVSPCLPPCPGVSRHRCRGPHSWGLHTPRPKPSRDPGPRSNDRHCEVVLSRPRLTAGSLEPRLSRQALGLPSGG